MQETASGNCPGTSYPQQSAYTATLTQSGNDVSMSTTTAGSASGTISGTHVSWSGSRAQGVGTVTYFFSGAVDAAGSKLSGTATWTWSGGGATCDGTAAVTATRKGASGPLPASSTIPAPAVTATAGYRQVTISWPHVTGAREYRVYRSTTPDVATTGVLVVDILTSGTDVNLPLGWLANGTTYYIAAQTLDVNGASTLSNVASATPSSSHPRPATPTLLSAVPGTGAVTLSFTAVPGAARYRIVWSSTSPLTTYDSLQTVPYFTYVFDANPVTIKAGLVAGTACSLVVTAWNVDGESEPSPALTATPE